ncbi:MAG: PQQ-binding-like beta-propeller repeat protein, partial [Acidobacteriota bacterium]
MRPLWFSLTFLIVVSCSTAPPAVQPSLSTPVQSVPAVEWPAYGRDAGGSRYSPAAEIDRRNVRQLRQAWVFRTGDYAVGSGATRDESTPIFIDGTLYVSTPFGRIIALDPDSGEERWSFDPRIDLSGDYGDFANRGVSTWLDSSLDQGQPCKRRIYVGTIDARLIAVNAVDGKPCLDFGEGGTIALTSGLLNGPEYKGEYQVTSPPAIINDLVVVGSAIADNHRANAPSGVVRAFDARTGALRWSFDPVPRSAAAANRSTWAGSSADVTGAANAWAPISADPERDLLFVPTGSPSPDFYGGERVGENLYANSVVALRGATGEVVWHFQVVHHDIWDYDVASQPTLIELQRDGHAVPALIQATKMGHIFVLNRETGEPIFPVEERPTPRSDVAGEEPWPTQPFPVKPAPLGPETMTEAWGLTPSDRKWCRKELAAMRSEGIFTPTSLRGTIIMPGNIGGSNWSGVAVDPR